MEREQYQEFETLCDVITLIVASYNKRKYLPDWLFRYWHPRGQFVAGILSHIKKLKRQVKSDSYEKSMDRLLKILDRYRYFLAVHTESVRLHDKIQDALIATFCFTKDDVNTYNTLVKQQKTPEAYLKRLTQNKELLEYQKYYKQQHAIFGRRIERFTDEEIAMAAKSSLINGKFLERFGMRWVIQHGLHYVRGELEAIRNRQQFSGFMTAYALEGYLEKIKRLIISCEEPTSDELALVQNARYLLETITNSVLEESQRPSYRDLIASCYWVDELLQQAKAAFEI